jgi:hypothetical protein
MTTKEIFDIGSAVLVSFSTFSLVYYLIYLAVAK